jgi:hypothetical protein
MRPDSESSPAGSAEPVNSSLAQVAAGSETYASSAPGSAVAHMQGPALTSSGSEGIVQANSSPPGFAVGTLCSPTHAISCRVIVLTNDRTVALGRPRSLYPTPPRRRNRPSRGRQRFDRKIFHQRRSTMAHTSQGGEPRRIGQDWAADAGYRYVMARIEALEWLRQRSEGLG